MEGLYEQYKKYCPPLSEREKAQIEKDKKERGIYSTEKETEIGYDRAVKYLNEWRDKGMVYPDIPDAAEQFPGIDPKGCYTEIDLSYKARVQKLLGACQSRPAPIREFTETFVDKKLSTFILETFCARIQDYRMAQKLSPSEDAASDNEDMEEKYQIMLERSLKHIEDDLGELEYINGLSDREPDWQELLANVGKKEKRRVAELLESRNVPATAEQGLKINFMDFDSIVAQKYFSNPLSLGKGPETLPQDVANAASLEGLLDRYASATADMVLNPAFSRGEKATAGHLNRVDLIIVDGRTVGEILAERERNTPRNSNITLDEYRRQQTNEIVAAGLMAGKRVEAFLPDERGRIPKEPIQITKSGYEPSPLKKVTLNAWERHFSKHGYFKEKAAKAAEYQKFMEARERVRVKNQSVLGSDMQRSTSRNIKEMFFRKWVEDNGPIPDSMAGSFSTGRGALTTTTVCAMLNEGYSMEDILDPEKYADVKLEVGEKTANRMRADDKEWIAHTLYYGRKALNREMDRLADFDITDPELMFSERAAPLRFAGMVTFDLNQEVNRIKPQMLAEAERDTPGRGKQTLEEHFETGDSAAVYVSTACKAMEAMARYSEAAPKDRSAMVGQIAKWEYARGIFAQRRAANPQARITGIAEGVEYMAVDSLLRKDSAFQEMDQRLRTDGEFAASVGKAISGGELGKRIKITFDSKTANTTFRIDSERIEKAAARNVRLQKTVQKNEAEEAEKQVKEEQKAQEKAAREKQKAQEKAAKTPGRRR